MSEVIVRKINEVHMEVEAEAGILYELHDYFAFRVPGYQFSPKFKAGFWDGYIRLLHLGKRQLYCGLFHKLQHFCDERGYTLTDPKGDFVDEDINLKQVLTFLDTLNIPAKYKPRDYQIKAFVKALRKRRLTLLSPTSSGKSLIIYLICRWYMQFGLRPLIIVPNITLINQMSDDFADYGYEEEVHKIKGGAEKYSDEMITISTWQSLMKMPSPYFEQYGVVIGDEAHGAKAKEFSGVLEKCTQIKYRVGTTGTLDDTKANPIIIQGLFGPIHVTTTTEKLMKEGHVAQLDIKCLVLKYPEDVAKAAKNFTYQEEIDWICANERRNRFVKNLVASLKGNTMILFDYVEKHARPVFQMLRENIPEKEFFWIAGDVDGEERNEIRKIVDSHENAVLCASKKTSGTGLSIRNIHNSIFISPRKAKIETLQNIGRGLRKSDVKNNVTLYDIVDDLSYKKHKNYTLEHFEERAKIYSREKFSFKIYTIGIKV